MSTYPDHILRVGSQQLAELKRKAAEFERQLWDAHESLEQEMEQAASGTDVIVDGQQETFNWTTEDTEDAVGPNSDGRAVIDVARAPGDVALDEAGRGADGRAPVDLTPAQGDAEPDAPSPAYMPDERTARLIDHGRQPPKRSHRGRNIVLTGLAIAIAAALITILVLAVSRPGRPGPPASPRSSARSRRPARTRTCGPSRARSTSPVPGPPVRSCGSSR